MVLIDELDAHMHPKWQQMIVHRLKKAFPNVQFIASTHSPLIVGGLEKAEVTRFVLDNNVVNALDFEPDMTLGRTDQILTGELFGLHNTFDPGTQKLLEQYQALLAKSERNEQEQSLFLELGERLEKQIPPSPTEFVRRRSRELLDILQPLKLSEFPEGIRQELGDRITRLSKSMRSTEAL